MFTRQVSVVQLCISYYRLDCPLTRKLSMFTGKFIIDWSAHQLVNEGGRTVDKVYVTHGVLEPSITIFVEA